MSRLNIVVFGATGFTGKVVVQELANLAKQESFTWGIAGRSQTKMNQLLTDCHINVETILVDIQDPPSINTMCSRASILINCVGPYRFFGEQIVKECITTSTHHLDFSGEPEFLETVQLKYNKPAQEKRLFVIGSCGFDSAVADLGVAFTRQQISGELASIESVLSVDTPGKYAFNYATWQSAVHGFASVHNLSRVRRQLFGGVRLKKPLVKLERPVNLLGFFYDELTRKYCLEFMGSDRSVVERTQRLNDEFMRVKAFNYSPYFTVGDLKGAIVFYVYAFVFALLGKFKLGRYLLLKVRETIFT